MKYLILVVSSFIAALVSEAAGLAMVGGTFLANRIIKNMNKNKFQKYVAILLCVVGAIC